MTRPREEEKALVRDVLLGSDTAISEFARYLAKIPTLVRLISDRYSLGVTEQERPDVSQDCLTIIWKKLPEYRADSSLLTWMFGMVALEVRNSLRRLRKTQQTGGLSPDQWGEVRCPRDESDRYMLRLDLRDGLEHLQDQEKRVVRLKYFEALTLDEIAGRISVRASHARTLYYRGLRRLREYLSNRSWGNDS